MGDLSRLPFPFDEDTYMYSTNVEPAGVPHPTEHGSWGETTWVVDEHYEAEVAERARILAADPARCQVLPHMQLAAWDVVEHITTSLARDYPQHFSLVADGEQRTWTNGLVGLEQTFTPGDPATLPLEPFEWITRQVQEDVELLDQRGDDLFLDAGILTFGADWSLDFDLGMSFLEIHGPVPRVHELGVIPRAHRFLLGLTADAPFRRTNWTLTVDRRLDTGTERYPEWGPARASLTPADVGRRVHLRIEVQHLIRLPRSNAVMFGIHTHLVSLEDLCAVPVWAQRTRNVLASLPGDLVDYKGLTRYRDLAVDWLAEHAPDPKRAAA
jgi:hypothetical protein